MFTTTGAGLRAGVELRRTLLTIARQAESDLDGVCGDGADRKVHRLRLRMKKLQALYPMLAPGVSPGKRTSLRKCVRRIKHGLSRKRDQQVMTALIASLGAGLSGKSKGAGAKLPAKALKASQQTALRKLLSSLILKIQQIKPGEITAAQITSAHLATQVLVYRNYRVCLKKPSNKHMHRWRRTVKHLYFQSLFMRHPGPQVMLITRLDHVLGKLHDHALLKQRVHVRGKLKKAIKDKIHKLRTKAFQKARRLLGPPC